MSGGVDSSVTAAILLEYGYEVVGVTFRMFPWFNTKHLEDAKKVAEILNINHIVLDFCDVFEKEVINYFVNEYARGRTPNPCVVCNKKIKFGLALTHALKLGFDYLATGHYAKVIYDENLKRFLIKKASSRKDQSYCLYTLDQQQLAHAIFPLSDFEKPQIREKAKDIGLPIHDKPDSQDVCFIQGDYCDFIKKRIGPFEFGNFLDENGNVLGTHKGIFGYTVGQRKGLKIFSDKRLYVNSINAKENTIILGNSKKIKNLVASNLNFIPFDKLESPMRVSARTRYNCQESAATIIPITDNKEFKVNVSFDSEIKFAAPGQSVVFYDNDNVLIGGGTIE
jgi:tRNA-specific 2-thiouridylase